MTETNLTATLLISCSDQRGLVATIAGFVYRNGGNIIHADQHTDIGEQVFVQRVEWEMADFGIPREDLLAAFQPIAASYGMNWSLHFSDEIPRLAVFVSRQGHCLYDLLARRRMGELDAEIPVVVSNHQILEKAATDFGAEFFHIPVDAATKPQQEAQILDVLRKWRIDLVVLARYMQVLSPEFVQNYPHSIINIHHSFLPAFAGAQPYRQAYQRGVKLIGATAHYATAELDGGPIIAQNTAMVTHRDTEATMIHKGRDLEMVTLARAVELHLHHRTIVYGNKTAVFD
jgi:formyltetrahydrofolate deformylase